YSNGLEISFLGAPSRAPGWTPPLVKLLTDPTDTVSTRLHFAVGHQIYTPEDISLEVPDPEDRPYAGLLYGSVGTVINTNDRRFDQIQGLFGVVGPASQADSLQLLWHDVIQAQRPNGWETQISNRVVGELSWRRTYVLPLVGQPRERGLGFQFAPHAGFRAGNLTTSVGAGGLFRLGLNLPVDITPAQLKPNQPGNAYFEPTAKAGIYGFAGVEGRYVPRNLFLDETSDNGFGVTREDFVGDAIIGAAAYFGPARLSFSFTFRTTQYNEQERSTQFGSAALVFNF
ncbi:MAG: lipid A deacylase LpxR family protein, partial [Pseudomonadota bacterium]